VSANASAKGTIGPNGVLSLTGTGHAEASAKDNYTGDPRTDGAVNAHGDVLEGEEIEFKLGSPATYTFSQTGSPTGSGTGTVTVQLERIQPDFQQIALTPTGSLDPGTYELNSSDQAVATAATCFTSCMNSVNETVDHSFALTVTPSP
jgi:hypothetical protein